MSRALVCVLPSGVRVIERNEYPRTPHTLRYRLCKLRVGKSFIFPIDVGLGEEAEGNKRAQAMAVQR